ncbi:hypothetical protein [Ideonella livida]|uniref:Uncharacterized protein n=1 Tax=Ideonella livida TaxID=2707176 RepID=A0A7C9PKI8_9BURK|nr:hypothetical protein [Ideonella livida]NDY93531.1 hypothetical protein [Ideonella livida]
MAAGSPTDRSAIAYTRDNLVRMEAERPRSALAATPRPAHPGAGQGIALACCTKGLKGEMKW